MVTYLCPLLCCSLIDTASRREERPVETAQLRLLVHKSAVGAIIGKAGQTIKDIQAETGARVQVSNETLPSSSEKTVSRATTTVDARSPAQPMTHTDVHTFTHPRTPVAVLCV
jgi:polyribonucleotide nucleotidyltransferase